MSFTRCQARVWIRIGSALCGALMLFIGGCALFGGGNASLQRASGYDVKAPPDWKPADAHGESDLAYRTAWGHIATLTSSCNSDTKAPLEILTKNLLLGARMKTVMDREKVAIDGATGLHSYVTAMFENVRFYLQLFVLPMRGCLFDFSLVSPRPISDQEKGEFMRFVNSFTYGTH